MLTLDGGMKTANAYKGKISSEFMKCIEEHDGKEMIVPEKFEIELWRLEAENYNIPVEKLLEIRKKYFGRTHSILSYENFKQTYEQFKNELPEHLAYAMFLSGKLSTIHDL